MTFANTFTDDYTVMVDLSLNTADVLDATNQIELYNGSADPYTGNAPLPGDFLALGSSRALHVPAPSPLAMIGLGIGLVLARGRR